VLQKQALSLKALATNIDLSDGMTARTMDIQSEYQAAISHSKSAVSNTDGSRRSSKDVCGGIGEKVVQGDTNPAPPATGYTGHVAQSEEADAPCPAAAPPTAVGEEDTVQTIASEPATSIETYSCTAEPADSVVNMSATSAGSSVIRHSRGRAGNKTLTRSPAKATLATSVLHLADKTQPKGGKTSKGKATKAPVRVVEPADDISIADVNSVEYMSELNSMNFGPVDDYMDFEPEPAAPAPEPIREEAAAAAAASAPAPAVPAVPDVVEIPPSSAKKISKRYNTECQSKFVAPKVAYAKFADSLNRPVAGAKSGISKDGIDRSRVQGDFFGADLRESNYKRGSTAVSGLPAPPVAAAVVPPTPPAAVTPPPAPTPPAPVVAPSPAPAPVAPPAPPSLCSSAVSLASATPSSSNGRYRVMSDTSSDTQLSSKYREIVARNKAVREGTAVNLDRGTHYNGSAPITAMKSTVFAPMRQGNYVPPPVTTNGNFTNSSGCPGGNPILVHKRYPMMSDKQVGRWSSEMARSNRTAFESRRQTNPNRNSHAK
jgi:hypothetical protein